MKRVLVALDARRINIQVVDFACYIARLTRSKLTGVFVESGQPSEDVAATDSSNTDEGPFVITGSTNLLVENRRAFREACCNREINCTLYREEPVTVSDFIKETRFAELLVLDPEMSFKERKEQIPTDFVKEVLAHSECPVVLSPVNFYGIDEVLFAYDGSAEAVFAIKQFIYLFPEYSEKKITVLQINDADNNNFTEKTKIEELLQLHYAGIRFELLHGKPADELFGYLLGKKNRFVVMGAFGRSILSGMFKRSTAELIISALNLPVFITHHKY